MQVNKEGKHEISQETAPESKAQGKAKGIAEKEKAGDGTEGAAVSRSEAGAEKEVGSKSKWESKARPRVGLFAGCVTDFIYPEIGIAIVKVLERAGFPVVFPQGQTCCGFPALQMGAPEVMAEVARKNLAAFEDAGVDYILTPCPTCTHAMKNIYPELLAGDPALQARTAAMAARVHDFAEFLYRQIKDGNAPGLRFKKLNKRVTYHDSCHLKRSLGVTLEPRELLRIAGADLVEMPYADRCCGFGGSYSLKYPELSAQILDQKLDCIRETGAELVAVECPGCLMQLRKGLAERGEKAVEVRFLAEILADQL